MGDAAKHDPDPRRLVGPVPSGTDHAVCAENPGVEARADTVERGRELTEPARETGTRGAQRAKRGSHVVLLSGGMDSAYCLHWSLERASETTALFVDYGQRASVQEGLAARRIAAKAQVPLAVWEMRVSWHATLCSLSRPLRAGLDDDGISNAFVPGRNLHLLTIAAARAREVGADTVVIGCCAHDAKAFPDCRPQFLRAAADAVSLAYARKVRVTAPALRLTKAEILRAASPAACAAIDESHSCYTPLPSGPCGECDACAVRAAAFAAVLAP